MERVFKKDGIDSCLFAMLLSIALATCLALTLDQSRKTKDCALDMLSTIIISVPVRFLKKLQTKKD